jgi:hypothetical protein
LHFSTSLPLVAQTYQASGTMIVTFTIDDVNGANAAPDPMITILPRGCVAPPLVDRKLGRARRP